MNLYHERIHTTARALQPKFAHFLEQSKQAGYRILVVRAWESPEAQFLKYQKGRALDPATGEWEVVDRAQVITNAKPGESGHNVVSEDGAPAATCIDVIPLDLRGRPLWALPRESQIELDARWREAYGRSKREGWAELYRIASRAGLDPYGDSWGASLAWDEGHLEEPAYWLIMKELGLRYPTWNPRAVA